MQNLDKTKLVQMILYSACAGAAAGLIAASQGASVKVSILTGCAAFATNIGAYWATSPKTPPAGGA